MKLTFTIAWRNILRHKGKSLVIGAILFTGAFLMTLGNGVVSGMAEGVRNNIINGFMGDIVLISDKQQSENILLNMTGTSIEPITSYKTIKRVLAGQPSVRRFLPAGKNLAMLLNDSSATPAFIYLLGADFAEYRKMFPDNFRVIEGSYPVSGARALLIPAAARDEMYDYGNIWYLPEGGSPVRKNLKKEALARIGELTVSSSVVMMGMTSGANTTTDVRFGVKGIISYRSLNKIFGHFCLVDIESYRECLGYFTSGDNSAEVPPEEKKLLGLDGSGLDALFGAGDLLVSAGAAHAVKQRTAAAVKKAPEDAENGAYNVVFIKLNDGVRYADAIAGLDRALKEAGAGVRAVPWNKASGPIGGMAVIIKGALFLFTALLFCVAVIIIVNTLTMAALERSSEIGMMRAVGARKSFISGMFLGETALLSAVFGGAGVLAGILAVEAIPLLKITTDNDMLQLLYGGDMFRPLLNSGDIALTVFQLVVVTVIASLYPMRVARSITPLDAISRD